MKRFHRTRIVLAFGAALAFFVVNGVWSYLMVTRLIRNERLVAHTHEVLGELDEVLLALTAAETAQRGFIITGDTAYLEPYHTSDPLVAEHLSRLRGITQDNPEQQERAARLESLIAARLSVIHESLRAAQLEGSDAARQVVLSGRGKQQMDAIRKLAAVIQQREQELLRIRSRESQASGRFAVVSLAAAAVLGMALVLFTGSLILRYLEERRRSEEALQKAHDELEIRVQERTADLATANERLRRFTQELERSNRELQDFAFVASHDLQEPLRKIQAFGDRLRSKHGAALGTEGLDYLERMQRAAQRMHILINDLLTFSRVTSKAQPFVTVDLNDILRGVLSDLEIRIQQTGATVEAGVLPVLEADPLQMRQLLQNLVGNALKFHAPGASPLVRVGGAVGRDGGVPRARLTVEDNGIGFDEKYLDRIFTPFQRLHGRTEYEGTGMGLAVCRRIVERHNGTLMAESEPGRGARFIVILPVQQTQGGAA